MKLALGYSTKDQVELTEQTYSRLDLSGISMYWCDGSRTGEGRGFPYKRFNCIPDYVYGGADAAIAWKLSRMLRADRNYTHIGLIENDVLLDEDWLEPTMQLFEKGKQDGLEPGAVSPRSYVDRILIQRDGYAVMHNIGAGAIIFTREAAEIVLRSFRTYWWPHNVRLFAQISGIDLRTYAAFKGQEHFVTSDWGWEAQLARHGLASLALTPAKCQMIGQVPPLKEQGLELTTDSSPLAGRDEPSLMIYQATLANIRDGIYKADLPAIIHRDGASMLFFAHQLGYLAGGPTWQGTTELRSSQGFGPFAYRAGAGGASLGVRIFGSCSFLVSGGDAGSSVTIQDTRSGFKFAPALPPEAGHPISITVPGGPVPRMVTMDMAEGATFHGLSCDDPQMLDTTFKFSWDQLPEAK